MRTASIAAALIGCLTVATAAPAATLRVPEDYASIGLGLAAALPGDVVVLGKLLGFVIGGHNRSFCFSPLFLLLSVF